MRPDERPRFASFPIAFWVAGRRVLVVGEGEQALQKLRLLTRTKAKLELLAANPRLDLAAHAEAHGVPILNAEPCHCRIAGAGLVFVATGDETRDGVISARARACGVPVNVVDRPHLSDFATPAIVDRAPVAIAISTDGHAPVLAVRLRGAIEGMLAPNLGRLGQLAEAVRATVLARMHDFSARRALWARLFDGRAGRLALDGDLERATAAAHAEIARAERAAPAEGAVHLIGAGTGESDLLTLRAQRILLSADVIVAEDDVPEEIVAMGRRDADRERVGGDAAGRLVALAWAGKRVARLTMGAGRFETEASALRAAGIEVETVPGVARAMGMAATRFAGEGLSPPPGGGRDGAHQRHPKTGSTKTAIEHAA